MIPQRKSQEIQKLLRQGDDVSLRRGKKLLKDWLREEPNCWEPHVLMAIMYASENKPDRAQGFFATAKQLASSEPQVWINSSIFRQSRGDYEIALQEASHAAILSGDNIINTAKAHRQAGYCLIELFRLEEARAVLQRVEQVGFFGIENFVLLVVTGHLQEAIERTAKQRNEWGDLNIAGFVRMPEGDVFSRINPLWVFICEATAEHDPDVVARCITQPPEHLTPGTREYVNWWLAVVNEEGWSDGVRETLDIAAVPGLMDAILASRQEPREKRISLKELRG